MCPTKNTFPFTNGDRKLREIFTYFFLGMRDHPCTITILTINFSLDLLLRWLEKIQTYSPNGGENMAICYGIESLKKTPNQNKPADYQPGQSSVLGMGLCIPNYLSYLIGIHVQGQGCRFGPKNPSRQTLVKPPISRSLANICGYRGQICSLEGGPQSQQFVSIGAP